MSSRLKIAASTLLHLGSSMVSSSLYSSRQPPSSLYSHRHLATRDKMDSVIDLSDASRALDLARIRAQLM